MLCIDVSMYIAYLQIKRSSLKYRNNEIMKNHL